MPLFRVTRTLDVDEKWPIDAARKALITHRDLYGLALGFEVTKLRRSPRGSIPCGRSVTIELNPDNPLGRPPAVFTGEEVCCGHCGSADTRYLEDVGQYCRLTAKNGALYATSSDLERDPDSADPRLWCAECGKDSELPCAIQWVDSP